MGPMSDTPASDVPQVDVSTLPDDAVVLDVREKNEWEAGRAPNAILSPLGNLGTSLGNVPHGEQVPVVCSSGGRSARAVEWLRREGYDAVNVEGGMKAWSSAGKPMTSSTDQEPRVI